MKLISVFILIIMLHFATAQQLAFPNAQGAGKFTKGGRGTTTTPTTVFFVTNLKDDGLVGCLRYALSQTAANRTVVFTVSGTIHLLSNLSIKANTTIAGQSAPGNGICIADYNVSLGGNNIIVRYLRFRLGDKNQLKTTPTACGVPVTPFTATCMPLNGSGGDDAFSGTGRKNIIIDHCTMSWSNDEACSIYSGDSTTIQWCMMSEPLNFSYHFETGDIDFERHGYGGIWGGKTASFHHNLFAHCQGRACRFDGSRNLGTGSVAGLENCDFSNNVLYNWGAYNVNGGEGGNYNIQNNYYKYGSNSSNKKMIINPYATAPLPWGKYYVNGNFVDGSASNTNNNWLGVVVNGGSLSDTATIKVATPFAVGNLNLQPAIDAYNDVIASVGASLPYRDTLDQRIINNVKNRTGKLIDCQGNYPHGTAYNLTNAAWPTLLSGTAPTDTDADGMPNWWETRSLLNPSIATDRNTIASNGYTNIENYLDSIPAWNNHANFITFTGNKINSSLANFYFSTSWVKDGFTYGLFRSSDSLGVYNQIATVASEMNTVNFAINDAALLSSNSFYKIGSYKLNTTPDTLYSNIAKIVGDGLPIKLKNYQVALTAQKQISNIWTTDSEVNTLHFNVQRSIDGKNFATIGTVAAKGFGEYSFIDALGNFVQLPNKLYYRLEIVDIDGKTSFSSTKIVGLNPKTVSIYPNPASNFVNIDCFEAKQIIIVDCLGKTVKQVNTQQVNTQQLAKGVYIVKAILNTGEIIAKKLIVQ
jgi:Secretion system C-terminal sorting domain